MEGELIMDEQKEYTTGDLVKMFKCMRCNHQWIPRKLNIIPLTCSKCHSAYWRMPRIRARRSVLKP